MPTGRRSLPVGAMQEGPALGRRQLGDMELSGAIAPLARDLSCAQAAASHGHHAFGGHAVLPFPHAGSQGGALHGSKIGVHPVTAAPVAETPGQAATALLTRRWGKAPIRWRRTKRAVASAATNLL